jgi:hypothetical protein
MRITAAEDRLRELNLEQASLEKDIAKGHISGPAGSSTTRVSGLGPRKTLPKIPGTRRVPSRRRL